MDPIRIISYYYSGVSVYPRHRMGGCLWNNSHGKITNDHQPAGDNHNLIRTERIGSGVTTEYYIQNRVILESV